MTYKLFSDLVSDLARRLQYLHCNRQQSCYLLPAAPSALPCSLTMWPFLVRLMGAFTSKGEPMTDYRKNAKKVYEQKAKRPLSKPMLELADIVGRFLSTDADATRCIDRMQAAGVTLGFDFSEGSRRHADLKTALAMQLGRNLNAGERRRLCWIVSGSVPQKASGRVAQYLTDKAKAKAYRGQDIRGSQAIKNYA